MLIQITFPPECSVWYLKFCSIHLASGDHILYHIPDAKLYINAIFSPVQLEG